MKETLSIQKILNNNVVIIKDESDREIIVMGRGLAFSKKIGDSINPDMIDKTFTLNDTASTRFQELIVDIPIEHIQASEEIISHAKEKLGKELNEMIYISLVDHIYTSINRFKEGIKIHYFGTLKEFIPKNIP